MNALVSPARLHVAGPPEKEPTDTKAGWRYVQRCLRCDMLLKTDRWSELGATVVEMDNGEVSMGMPAHDGVERCEAGE